MEKIYYEVRCPGCGRTIKGRRGKDDYQKSFECKKCTTRFSLTFEHPDREELEERFFRGEIPAGPANRVAGHGATRNTFPFRLPRLRVTRPRFGVVFKRKK
jgi:hypothetical protein